MVERSTRAFHLVNFSLPAFLKHPQIVPWSQKLAAFASWSLAGQVVQLIGALIAVRTLTKEDYGYYSLATNETHTVQEFVEVAFAHAGLDWKEFVKYDARYERPAEVDLLIGDPAKAKKQLGWEPKVRFKELVQIMVDADVEMLEGKGLVHQHEG